MSSYCKACTHGRVYAWQAMNYERRLEVSRRSNRKCYAAWPLEKKRTKWYSHHDKSYARTVAYWQRQMEREP